MNKERDLIIGAAFISRTHMLFGVATVYGGLFADTHVQLEADSLCEDGCIWIQIKQCQLIRADM